ncbi:MAG TPA: HAD-IC family P-type ATPase [Longimicrobiales bacterium]|nr:HAD-IC family P-type ATPase [Longimicrobiales bacterium]
MTQGTSTHGSDSTPVWHALPADETLERLGVAAGTGLSAADARARLAKYGPNRLPEEQQESAFIRFVKQFHNVLIYILLIAAVFTGLLGEWIDTGVILAVVLVNAVIGFIQEGKAEQALEEIRRMLSLEADVLRDGRRQRVDAETLVPGDIVLLEGGDRVPADLRVIKARDARVEEAALTGESAPVSKSAEPVADDALLGDRRSLLFSSTLVTAGQLRGVVVGTGQATEIGRIGEMVSRVEKLTTPLLRKMDTFGRVLSVAILGLGALLFLLGWLLRGFSLTEMFLVVVSFAVAAIPEGLPAILTITLALGVQRMGRRNAILRRLPAVETLGSVTTICSDKTGTLTRNELTAGRVLLHDGDLEVAGSGYGVDGSVHRAEAQNHAMGAGEVPSGDVSADVRELAVAAALCNDGDISIDEDGTARAQGDPLDAALVVLARKAGIDTDRLRDTHERIDDIPFESANRFMATLHRAPDGGRRTFVKGAPEVVLEMCPGVDVSAWRQRIDAAAAEGYRMLALAAGHGNERDTLVASDLAGNLELLGVVGLMDPPREEAVEAVAKCQSAGIRVVMITGDHALTARSIGDRLGIGDGSDAVTGREIEAADDEEVAAIIRAHDIVARASPEHKLRLVQALQSMGEVVAMTGDGVNDAPALKQADIGVAMGIKGTEAAKSAAEMVLADDNFASIEVAVEEGRTVYDNLKKTILFVLPTNGGEALMVMAAVAFAMPELPLTPVQILWVNMVTSVTLALALAFEPTEPNIMDRPPRSRDAPILSRYLLTRIGYVSVVVATACITLFLLELSAGAAPDRARTVAVNALVTAEAFYLFNCRFVWRSSMGLRSLRGNNAVLIAVGILVLLQLGFTYLPLLNTWFGTAPIGILDWLWCILLGMVVFSIVEIEKRFGRRRLRRAQRAAKARRPVRGATA